MEHIPTTRLILIVSLATLLTACSSTRTDYTTFVDTRIGTESSFVLSYGNTYPATGRPFGMHQWSPQTGMHGNGWKYCYQSDEIVAFSQAHQCSPWTRDYATLAFFPESGELEVRSSQRGAKFSHDNETARPQYYSVTFRNGIKTEMAPTERGNHLRFSFPGNAAAYLIVDGEQNWTSMSLDPGNRTLKGSMSVIPPAGKAFNCWFFISFDTAFKSYGSWKDPNRQDIVEYTTPSILAHALNGKSEVLPAEITHEADTLNGYNAGMFLEFEPGSTVQVRMASSFISAEQAELNFNSELASHDTFEFSLKEGTEAWNSFLGRIDVEGGTLEQRQTFYSCLYHACLFPRMYHEYDADGNPHHYHPYTNTVYSGYGFNDIGYWDAFRSQFPLYNVIFPDMQGKYIQSIMESYRHDGFLPSWNFISESFGMIGNHAISLLADAWGKGIRTFDPEEALKAYAGDIKDESDEVKKLGWLRKNGYLLSLGRYGASEYEEKGYVPYPEYQYGTAMTLEYAYDDFCAWILAKATGNKEYEDKFAEHMFNYRNVFDPGVGFMRGRDANGKWTPDFSPIAWGGPFIEGNALHYNWSVFHDINGLIKLYGSDEEFCRHLDAVFEIPGIIDSGFYRDIYNEMVEMTATGLGQYEHGNQPIHHMPYLYDYAGQPWKTQFHVRRIMDKAYNPGSKGYPGDEDQGSMSSWFVMSALGFYSVTPGSTQYAIGSPLFEKADIYLENGRIFRIVAENNSKENVYIQSATLNGEPFERSWIDHKEIMSGGELHFIMGPEPNKKRCIDKKSAPFSITE